MIHTIRHHLFLALLILPLLAALILAASPALALKGSENPAPRDDSDEYAPDNASLPPDITAHPSLDPQDHFTPSEAASHEHTDDFTEEEAPSYPPPAPVDLIAPFELQFANHILRPGKYGFDIGLHGAFYYNETMLDGWNGLDFTFRLGYLHHFSMLGRLAAPWSIINLPNLNLAAGLGAEFFVLPATDAPHPFNYLQPIASLRLGIAAGPLRLRAEYDFHLLRRTHHVRAYLPIFTHLGLGLERTFTPTRTTHQNLHHTAATLIIPF